MVFLLLSAQFLPPLPGYLFLASSMALGTALAAGVLIVVCWVNTALSGEECWSRLFDMDMSTGLFVALVTALTLVHSIVADYFQPVDYGRCLPSLAMLALLLGGGITFGRALLASPERSVDIAVRVSFWVLCLVV
ncbi:MAG TPA: hypothetical protein VGG49_12300, partial [Steroidobacteraceae bacterium]